MTEAVTGKNSLPHCKTTNKIPDTKTY